MLSIKSNSMADIAARNLGTSYDSLATSVARLSSGLRINTAQDDAAGLAVRELIRADIAALRQGSRNAADGISLLQTAEGALAAIDDILVRMEELAEQAATESYSTDQRTIMENEFTELSSEIDRIVGNTSFNSINLLNNTTERQIHVGIGDTIAVTGSNLTADQLGVSGTREFDTGRGVSAEDGAYMTGGNAADEVSFTFDDNDGTVHELVVVIGNGDTNLDDLVDLINAESRSAVSGWNAASAVYDSTSGQYVLKLEAWATGNFTDMIVDADEDAGANGDVVWKVGADNIETGWVTVDGSDDVDLSTQAGGETALEAVQDAIGVKDLARAGFGYLMNRLQAAITVDGIVAENLSTAEARISDVDVATEMAAMTRTQVLAQAGIAMLAQANTIPQMALTLLR